MLVPIMGLMRRWRLIVPLLLSTMLGLVPANAAAQTDAIEDAKEQKENAYDQWLRAKQEMDDAVGVLADLEAQLADLNYRIDRMEGRIGEDESNIAELRISAQEPRSQCVHQQRQQLPRVGSRRRQHPGDPDRPAHHQSRLKREAPPRWIGSTPSPAIWPVRPPCSGKTTEVTSLEQQQADIVANLDEMATQAEALYVEAKKDYEAEVRAWEAAERARKIAEAARQSGAAGGLPPGTIPDFICPVAGQVSFTNDWGNPRSGGRTHKGTDMFAAKGTPVVAVVNGTVRFSDGGLGGTAIWVKGNGASFYYAHLDSQGGRPIPRRICDQRAPSSATSATQETHTVAPTISISNFIPGMAARSTHTQPWLPPARGVLSW